MVWYGCPVEFRHVSFLHFVWDVLSCVVYGWGLVYCKGRDAEGRGDGGCEMSWNVLTLGRFQYLDGRISFNNRVE